MVNSIESEVVLRTYRRSGRWIIDRSSLQQGRVWAAPRRDVVGLL